MRYTPWIIKIYDSVDDLQMLWRMYSTVSSIPLPMVFMAMGGSILIRRYR